MPLAGDLIVNTVTEEESTGVGGLVAARTLQADAAIVPEPSGLVVWVACRGSLLPRITVRGRAGHAGIHQLPPEQGGAVNAIEKMAIVLEAVRRLREHWAQRPRHPYLSAGDCVPTIVAGGEWLVSYPASCTLDCHIEYLPDRADERGYGSRVEREFTRLDRRRDARPTRGCASTRRRSSGASAAYRRPRSPTDDPIVQALLAAGGDLGQLQRARRPRQLARRRHADGRGRHPRGLLRARATSTARTPSTSTCRSTTSWPARSASR